MDADSTAAMIVGLAIFAACAGQLVALGLGIAGLFQQDTRWAFAVLGIVFSSAAVLGTGLLLVVGTAMG
jgi:hypothetical protein